MARGRIELPTRGFQSRPRTVPSSRIRASERETYVKGPQLATRVPLVSRAIDTAPDTGGTPQKSPSVPHFRPIVRMTRFPHWALSKFWGSYVATA